MPMCPLELIPVKTAQTVNNLFPEVRRYVWKRFMQSVDDIHGLVV